MAKKFEPQEALGLALRSTRLGMEYSQREVGELAGLDRTWISALECGRKNPAWGTVRRLCDALSLSVSALAKEAERYEAEGLATWRRKLAGQRVRELTK
jgi:transcriptional regulator with XRE-family HTH domain